MGKYSFETLQNNLKKDPKRYTDTAGCATDEKKRDSYKIIFLIYSQYMLLLKVANEINKHRNH